MKKLVMGSPDNLNSGADSYIKVNFIGKNKPSEANTEGICYIKENHQQTCQDFTIILIYNLPEEMNLEFEFFIQRDSVSFSEQPFLIQTNWKAIFTEDPILELTSSLVRNWLTQFGCIELDLEENIAHLCCEGFIERTKAQRINRIS